MLTSDMMFLIDQFLITTIEQWRKMKKGLVDWPGMADELEKMRDDWRLRRRDDEQH